MGVIKVMNRLYVIDPDIFCGRIITSARKESDGTIRMEYSDYTFDEYKKEKGLPNLVALTWEEFDSKYYQPYLDGLCKPLKEITEERWWEAFECLPPMRYTKFDNGSYFFISECYTADLYAFYARLDDKYYYGLRSKYKKHEELMQEINQLLNH